MNSVSIEIIPQEEIRGKVANRYFTSRYRRLYVEIDEALEKDGWMRIADFQDFETALKVNQAIRYHYKGRTIRFYKYNEHGGIEPQIFVRNKTTGERCQK